MTGAFEEIEETAMSAQSKYVVTSFHDFVKSDRQASKVRKLDLYRVTISHLFHDQARTYVSQTSAGVTQRSSCIDLDMYEPTGIGRDAPLLYVHTYVPCMQVQGTVNRTHVRSSQAHGTSPSARLSNPGSWSFYFGVGAYACVVRK